MDEKRLTPIKSIRAFCLECCGGSRNEVKACTVPYCPLYAYRLGHNPNISKRKMTEDQRQAVRDRLAKARDMRKATG